MRPLGVRNKAVALASATLLCAACSGGGGGGGGGGGSAAAAADAPPAAPAPAATYALSGEIRAAASSARDGDVNDPAAPFQSNDTLATAQPLANPVTLGGYVNRPGAGADGRSRAAGDVRDYYRVLLAEGQAVRLFVSGDGVADDLDLALLQPDGTLVASATGDNALEELSVPATGDYIVEVLAFAGAANYVLSIGQATPGAAAQPAQFVPGEVIVRFAMDADDPDAALLVEEELETMSLSWSGGRPEQAMLVGCDSMPQRDDAFRALGMEDLIPDDPAVRALPTGAQLERATPLLAKALRRRGNVRSADLNYIRRPLAVPADSFYPLQWHYPQINLPQAWDLVAPASGVVVAVIDSGIVPGHPDLAGQLVPGYDFVRDLVNADDGNGCDPDPTDPGDDAVGGSTFHGTHVAGTIAARTSLQPAESADGVAGVAWNARVMPLRALGPFGGTDFDIIQAIRYAAGLPNACNALPATPARVINMSIGGPGRNDAFEAVVQEARAAGVIVVAAAGNSGGTDPLYPAAYPGVLSVSAVDLDLGLASYSNYGSTIDLAAPGGDVGDRNGDGYLDGVLSTTFDDRPGQNEFGYAFAIGTSMASPHVAGVIALMLGANPALTPSDVDALLAGGQLTRDLGDAFRFGYGLIDAQAAVAAAIAAAGGDPPANPGRLAVSPDRLNFGAGTSQAELRAENAGGVDGAPLALASVTASTDDGNAWLSVTPAAVDANGLGTYTVAVDRAQAPAEGLYTGRIAFDSNLNDTEVAVIMLALAETPADDTGRHYVLLLDTATLASVASLGLEAQNGAYAFRFADVPPGSYRIVAGSDADNDGSICDPGEACGGYPTRDDPAVIVVGSDRTGLDFATGFATSVGAQGLGGPVRPPGYAR